MTIRRKCSECGEDLSFSEHDPCDNCSVLKFDLQFIPRATVAAALEELRAEMFNYAPVAAIDATIAALGLASTCAATPEERERQQMEARKQWILAGGDLPDMRADASLFVDTMPLTKFELEER